HAQRDAPLIHAVPVHGRALPARPHDVHRVLPRPRRGSGRGPPPGGGGGERPARARGWRGRGTVGSLAPPGALNVRPMAILGTVPGLWRSPFKARGAERPAAGDMGPQGLAGARGWAVRDEQAGEIRGAKKLPALLRCSARYVEEPGADGIPPVTITLPD